MSADITDDLLAPLRDRLPLRETMLSLGGREWRLTSVTDQEALLSNVRTETDLENFPYGLMLWPSAIGLAAQLLETPERVRGKRVLELGCGIGLAGLSACVAGASSVIQTDYQSDALTLARHNARANDVSGVRVEMGDWRAFPDWGRFDVVLGSDILYERSLHDTLEDLLPRLLVPGGLLLISDPLRPQSLDFAERIERKGSWLVTMEGRRVTTESGEREIALFSLHGT